jgi:apolipoprotein N-acyltransferase
LAGVPSVGALICYEAIFSGQIVDRNNRPDWLVNVTNDAWFGNSSGPRQHLAAARMRAVEEGLPLVRAANTGISAVIDPVGRITATLGAGQMGVIDAALPAALPPTPYSRFGEWLFLVLLILCGASGWALAAKNRA